MSKAPRRNSSQKITKVVIPVAGMGTRFLPATKALPKELLPIVDKPIIQHIVEEAVDAGLETVVFISSRSKVSINDHFDAADLTSFKLEQAGKKELIEDVLELSKKINIISIRQEIPRGLGHAILCAEPVINDDEPFAVILGDDIIDNGSGPSAIKQCIDYLDGKENASCVGVLEVPLEDSSKYGMVGIGAENLVTKFVEKPKPEDSPSTWALPGRYVFQPEIFHYIKQTAQGKGSEIQLTDAMALMLNDMSYYAVKMQGERFDTGDKLGYIKANVRYALQDEKYSENLRQWLRETIAAK